MVASIDDVNKPGSDSTDLQRQLLVELLNRDTAVQSFRMNHKLGERRYADTVTWRRQRTEPLSEEEQIVAWGSKDERAALERALEAAAGLKAGTWGSVEAFAMLAIEAKGRPEAQKLYEIARSAATGLSHGSWESVRALTWLARAERELGLQR